MRGKGEGERGGGGGKGRGRGKERGRGGGGEREGGERRCTYLEMLSTHPVMSIYTRNVRISKACKKLIIW